MMCVTAGGKDFSPVIQGAFNTYVSVLNPYSHYGSVLLPNGNVFCVPVAVSGSSYGRIYDPIASTFSTTPNFGAYTYYGGCLLEDGRVFCDPVNAAFPATIYNYLDNTFIQVTNGHSIQSSVRMEDGRVFGLTPSLGRIYDPISNLFTSTSNFPGGSLGYAGCVLMEDDRVFIIPNSPSTNKGALIYDPDDGSFFTTALLGVGARAGGALLPDGRIFCGVDAGNTSAKIYDPISNTVSTINIGSNTSSFCVLMADGRVYLTPYNWYAASKVYDPIGNVTSTISSLGSGTGKGGTLMLDGRVFLPNYTGSSAKIVGSPYYPTFQVDQTYPPLEYPIIDPHYNKL